LKESFEFVYLFGFIFLKEGKKAISTRVFREESFGPVSPTPII